MKKQNIVPPAPETIGPVIPQEVQAATTEGEAVAQEEAASALGSEEEGPAEADNPHLDLEAAKAEALEALAAEQALELEALKAAKAEALEALAAEQALELEALKAAAPAPALSFDTPFEVEGKRYAFAKPGKVSLKLKGDAKRIEFNKLDALNNAELLAKLVVQHPHLFVLIEN